MSAVDTGQLLALAFFGVLVLYLVFSVSRHVLRAVTERLWASRNGWTDATADAAESVVVRRHVIADPFAPEHPDREQFAELHAVYQAEHGADPISTKTTVPRAWRSDLHGLDTLLVNARTRIGERFDRGKAYSWNSYVFVTLPRVTPLLSLYPRYPGQPPVIARAEVPSGDALFDETFAMITDDRDFAARVLTERNRALLLRCAALLARPDGLPGSITIDDGTLICHEHYRKPVAEAARLAEPLAELGNSLVNPPG